MQSIERPKATYRKDYRAPEYRVESLELTFDLHEHATVVSNRMVISANSELPGQAVPLHLNGCEQELRGIWLNGELLNEAQYQLDDEGLLLTNPPRHFELEVQSLIDPSSNTALEGLYISSGIFSTQCEAEGFRKISYFPDRPDVMSLFTTTVIADKGRYPVLLSNGNLTARGDYEGGRHFATWNDPFAKPSYLFALVAGDLARVEDSFTTGSGREVALQIYVQHGNESKCEHAMASLKRAMQWDEEVYGREYDLDIYMIVAVDDFNMGAMENKGLNIFNSRCVLARPESATDRDFVDIEGVIAHEYFHNWSGNRVTCRDWFQLSLKEGFTVFRDQQFTADMNSAAIKRIDDVTMLRTHQFAEDAGPMAHPVRPDSYVEINNFYTLTVYEKGAEVVRMLHTLLGADGFRAGSDLYFQRYDGMAVTTDDFIDAMASANGIDLTQFKRWYELAGTPEVTARGQFDSERGHYHLTLTQRLKGAPNQQDQRRGPLQIPIRMALLGEDGQALPHSLLGEQGPSVIERVISLEQFEQSFTFAGIPSEPVPSLLRGFSAPVKLEFDYSDKQLARLMAHDSDEFNRWEAGERLSLRVILKMLNGLSPDHLSEGLSDAFARTLVDKQLDPALRAKALTLPEEGYIGEFLDVVDPQQIHRIRQGLRGTLAAAHRQPLLECYHAHGGTTGSSLDANSMGNRRLRNLALGYLMELQEAEIIDLCYQQYRQADNMTDRLAALMELVNSGAAQAQEALDNFYQQWRHDPLVVDKWFALQASSPQEDTLERVEGLLKHPDFRRTNPNRVRSLIGVFAMRNAVCFHRQDGAGYRLLGTEVLTMDGINPQIASRLVMPLTRWRRYNRERQGQMRGELERFMAHSALSVDLYEVVDKSLAQSTM